jgi:hypothetical protein
MAKLVVHGALLKCDQGVAPASLTVVPKNGTTGSQLAVATVNDNVPNANIAPFGGCNSTANPAVQAANGVTPQLCTPVPTGPWSGGSEYVTLNGQQALTSDSTCSCAWNGTIEITFPGQTPDVKG